MPYWCLECKKNHANNYKKHWKYKSKALVSKNPKLADLEKIKDDIREIKNLLGFWAIWVERKHPYWRIDEKFKDWVNDV